MIDTKFDLQKEVRIGSRVVFTITEQTGEVYRIDQGGVYVFVGDGQKGYWRWSQLMVRRARKKADMPTPIRFPKFGPPTICHCPTGRVKASIRHVKVICQKCKLPIGTESFPKRIRQAFTCWANSYKKYLQRCKKASLKGKGKARRRTRKHRS